MVMMRVEAEVESKKDGWSTIVVRPRRAVIIGRRPRIIAGRRRWRGRRHPVALGAVLKLGELIGLSRHGSSQEESDGRKQGEN